MKRHLKFISLNGNKTNGAEQAGIARTFTKANFRPVFAGS